MSFYLCCFDVKFLQKCQHEQPKHYKTSTMWEFWEDIMKKAIHKLELNVFLADKILEVINIHSKEAKNTTNLTGRIHDDEELSTTFFALPLKLVSKSCG